MTRVQKQAVDASRQATVRCAIYTRKSTEEGLDQEFNSLDAQRESAELFIASQKSAGWTCVADRYDDGVDRPIRSGQFYEYRLTS